MSILCSAHKCHSLNGEYVLLCTAGVQVPQYDEEFRQLFVLTLAKLKQVGSLSLACLLILTPHSTI